MDIRSISNPSLSPEDLHAKFQEKGKQIDELNISVGNLVGKIKEMEQTAPAKTGFSLIDGILRFLHMGLFEIAKSIQTQRKEALQAEQAIVGDKLLKATKKTLPYMSDTGVEQDMQEKKLKEMKKIFDKHFSK